MIAQDPAALAASGLEKAAQYARDVMTGRQVVGKLTRLAVARNCRDLEEGPHRGLVFDETAAGRALAFFGFLRHSKGELSGQPIELEPWQCWIVATVFGWQWEDTGRRRFRTIYEEIARKNGKTTQLAGLGCYGLTKDNEGGPEIYSAATKRDQARLMFDEASRMVQQSRALRRRVDAQRHRLVCSANWGKFEPLSSDAQSLDGLNPHFSLVDELHAHKTSEVWDVLKSALGARPQPLIWAITTAGFDKDGICYEVRDYAIKVLEGLIEDDAFFGVIYTLDEGDDWRDERNWVKANPNLHVSVDLEYLREQARQAAVMPRALTNFLTKHLNIWVSAESLWANVEAWKACAADYGIEDLEAAEAVYCGLDLSSVSDITALALVAMMPDGSWRTWCRSYLPADAVTERTRKALVPYEHWAREGWLQLTDGNVCDYNWIKADLAQLMDRLPVQEIAFDRWNSSQLVNDLMEEGAPMVAFGQGFASMNAPMKELERRYLAGEIEHPNDPVLNWAMSNVVVRNDPAGNIKPAKDRSSEKIDPVVALIMAVGRAMVAEGESIYNSRGLYL